MLQQEDIDDLLKTLIASKETETANDGQDEEARVYDFSRPDNIPIEFIKALEGINNSFAKSLSTLLASLFSIDAQVASVSVKRMTFSQYCRAVPEVSALCTFDIQPLAGEALAEVDSPVAWFLLDRALGGAGEIVENPRPLQTFAKGIMEEIFRKILRELGRSWESILPLQPRLNESFSSPSLAKIVHPEDSLLVSTFTITLPGIAGSITYAIPIYSLDFEHLMKEDVEKSADIGKIDRETEQEYIAHRLFSSPLDIRACLPASPISIGELTTLQEGDIVTFRTPSDDLLELRIGNECFFRGRAVTIEDKVAIEVVRAMEENYE